MNSNMLTGLIRSRQVKDYICQHFCDISEALQHALQYSEEEGLKAIQVPDNVAKTLYMLASLTSPRKILEIGTLGGYSTLWLAQALEDEGKLITLECDEKHVQVAKKNIAFTGKEDQIEIRQGLASDLLAQMIENNEGPFDVIFLDADKNNYPNYLEPCLQLSRSGTLILSDNLIPKRGTIGQPDPRDNEAVEIYTYNQMLKDHPLIETIFLTTLVGENGRIDALGVSRVK